VFENLQHDFPQRIVYRRAADTLIARIEADTPRARGRMADGRLPARVDRGVATHGKPDAWTQGRGAILRGNVLRSRG
jgi:hypothetical protein